MEVNGIPANYDEICSAKLVSTYVENFDSSPSVVCTSSRHLCQYFVIHAHNILAIWTVLFEDNAQVYIYSFQATTQVFGSCTYHFDGTSAATPIMSSIVALTLEAK